VKIGIAYQEDIGWGSIVNGMPNLKAKAKVLDKKKGISKFIYDNENNNNIENLFQINNFENFINEIDSDINKRKDYIRNYPLSPIGQEVQKVKDNGVGIYLIISHCFNEDLINFFIKATDDSWKKNEEKEQTQIIRYKHEFGESASLLDTLKSAIRGSKEHSASSKFIKALGNLVEKGQIFFLCTKIKKTELKEQITELFKEFENLSLLINKEELKHPSFLFFINKDEPFKIPDDKDYEIMKAKTLSKANSITEDDFSDWKNYMGISFIRSIDNFKNLEITNYSNKCPSKFLEDVSVLFKVPKKHLF